MNLEKLNPAPWYAVPGDDAGAVCHKVSGSPILIPEFSDEFDVMMRRGWTPYRLKTDKWDVMDSETGNCPAEFLDNSIDSWGDDPFTALVEADKWYRDNIENKE